ncbi:ABC transporter substrate-binding protein [Bifidobacterium scardovii]|uniref:Family 1 extracellular solute-binding protein n=1 Tax=Bifidobacterium scardovii TaxID=158787 RepID=A0A087D3D8_9BIFI|nr:extracellular solute-binding protein [Bifidobacterium scardovii]KFI90038.1 family 1 extracellular solute-binding protein [Bifidobacterium scardovii]MDK6349151.1 extracellular solute-binding protein [Bifidobacterium scardovii]MDU8980807.1 extracellular solute-binding protein [Bifidobacterium scardovii]BAQ32486.1 sugar ABC transporter substrate binding component [Bifidobacterium scardovii JCM 12489 = DSM 13734]
MKFNTKVKAAIAAVAAGAMLIPLAACGGSAADSGKITLSYLSWSNENDSKPYIDEFEKENPDIKIDFSYAPPTAEYIQTLQTRLVGNQAPDVFVITSENKAELIKNGYAMDLTGKPYTEKLSDANKEFLTKDGKLYGQSISSWAAGIAYNKDLLKQVGYTEFPKTWDDFLALCKKLKAAGVSPYIESIADGNDRIPDSFTGAIMAKKGVDLTTLADGNTPGTNELEGIKAWMKVYDEGYADRNAVGVSGDDAKTQFVNGQVAMYTTGAWDFETFKQSSFDWGFAPIPAIDSEHEQYAQGSPSPGLAIYSKLSGDKLKAAEKFLTFMVSDWSLKKHSEAGDAITVSGFNSDVDEHYKDVYENNVKTGKYFLLTNFYNKPDVLGSTNTSEVQQLVQGAITPEQWAKNIDEKMASAQQ